MLPHPDDGHLVDPALDLIFKIAMGFDPVEDDDLVGPAADIRVDVDWRSKSRSADLLHLHGRDNGSPHNLLGDAQVVEHTGLPLRGGAAVRTHAGNDKRGRPKGFQTGYDDIQHLGAVTNAAASGRDGDALSRFDFHRQVEMVKKRIHLLFHVSQPGACDFLADLEYTWQGIHVSLLVKRSKRIRKFLEVYSTVFRTAIPSYRKSKNLLLQRPTIPYVCSISGFVRTFYLLSFTNSSSQ